MSLESCECSYEACQCSGGCAFPAICMVYVPDTDSEEQLCSECRDDRLWTFEFARIISK
jgi:hypothetical protein